MIPFRRRHTLALLEHLTGSRLPLDTALSNYFRAHKAIGSKDRLAISTAIYTLVRWQGALDSALSQPITWEKRLDAYATTDLQTIIQNDQLPMHVRCSFSKVLFEKMAAEYGKEKAFEICLVLNERAPLTLRVNTSKTTRSALKADLPIKLHNAPFPTALFVEGRANLFQFPQFKAGLFECQDMGSQQMAALVKAKPGDHVLDMCSGSGGKTLAIAPLLEGKGQIYLHDIRPRALAQAKQRLKRAGITNAKICPKLPNQKMDHILVDAPCSGTGTLRRNPDLKWKFSEEMLHTLVATQREILLNALTYLKPGGHLIYVTCSLLSEENQSQVEFLKEKTALKHIESVQLLPTSGSHDGFFGAVFKS
jgi:16S rRNA C967 or C1407 C5-methylase (RsmB/RsmF family)